MTDIHIPLCRRELPSFVQAGCSRQLPAVFYSLQDEGKDGRRWQGAAGSSRLVQSARAWGVPCRTVPGCDRAFFQLQPGQSSSFHITS